MAMGDNDTAYFSIPVTSFRSRKAAQLCAYFALKCEGKIEKLKLIKLIYATEREFVREYRMPMLFDEFYSLHNGPICSSTLNGINGIVQTDAKKIWDNYIARNGNVVVAVKNFSQDDLDELSEAEIENIEKVWKRLGHKTASGLRNYSHENFPEYTDVEKGNRLPISYKDLFEGLGFDHGDDFDQEVQSMRKAESALCG